MSNEHIKALTENNNKLLKSNIQLNAQLATLKADHENFKGQVKSKLESTIRLYDNSNTKVLEYLIRNNLVIKDSEHHISIYQIFPIKLP